MNIIFSFHLQWKQNWSLASQTYLMVSVLNDYDPKRGIAKEGGGNTNPTQEQKQEDRK